VVAVYLVFFRARASEEDKIANNLDAYIMGGDEIISLEKALEEGMVVRTSVETPTENGPQRWTYRYQEVNDTPSKLAASYVDLLRGEEEGFVFTDMENHELEEAPDMDQTIGSVVLERASAENLLPEEEQEKTEDGETVSKILQLVLAWSETSLAVQVSQPEGNILPPVVEEPVGSKAPEPVALMAQLEYFNNLPAGKLGLPGDSMAEYRVYPVEGWVRVSGITCRMLNVYVLDLPEESNTYMGTYYLSSDNSELFKLDSSGTIVKVDLS
nr:hypothetical protein [Oscillospiraceae bacterium]